MPLISAQTRQHASDLARRFSLAEPFRHVVIDGFLDEDFCRRLRTDFPNFEERHALNEMGQVGGKAVRMDVRDISDAYRELDRHLQSQEFLDFVSAVTGIPDLLHDPDYVGGGTHENRHGQGLDAHVDFNYHPRTRWHRRLNLIVYLNEQWEPDWGGELELHSDPWDASANRTTAVSPLMNRAVIFETTESSWHGFSRIELPEGARSNSRKSFAIYLYTSTRPASETAPPHATIYVPDMMPVDWQVGRTLESGDLAELRNRFGRLRTQLRFLYDREKQFGKQIARLETALSEVRDSMRLEIQGHATQSRGATGIWPDGWVSTHLTASFMPTRNARSLILDLWSPKQLPSEQELRIEIDGSVYSQVLARGSRTTVKLKLNSSKGREISLQISAACSWVPASSGDAGDERELAFKILGISLDD